MLPNITAYDNMIMIRIYRLRKTNHATSVFASTSDRIRIAGAIDKDIPPPGSYNVESSYHESQSRQFLEF